MTLFGILLLIAGVLLAIRATRTLEGTPPTRRSERVALICSFAAALIASCGLLVVPVYSGLAVGASFTRSGQVVSASAESRRTLLEVSGAPVALPLALPVSCAGFPVVFYRSRRRRSLEAIAATLLAAFTVVAGFSVGLFYLPSATAMLMAAALGRQIRAFA